MSEGPKRVDFEDAGDRDVLIAAYRHDAHKLNGKSHDHAQDTFQGVPVNQPVPYGADDDASALSRPSGKPQQTVLTPASL